MDVYIVKVYCFVVGKVKKGGFKNYCLDDLVVDIIIYFLE